MKDETTIAIVGIVGLFAFLGLLVFLAQTQQKSVQIPATTTSYVPVRRITQADLQTARTMLELQ